MTFWDDIATNGTADANMCHVPVDRCLARLDPIVDLAPGYVMELGCGVGRLTEPFARLLALAHPESLPFVVGIDSSAKLLQMAFDRRITPNVDYQHNDGLTIPDRLDDRYGPLDAAYSIGMFQHVPDTVMHSYIEQVRFHLRSGGVFVFQFVYEGEEAPLSFIRHPAHVVVKMSNWTTVQVSDDEENRWSWITAVK